MKVLMIDDKPESKDCTGVTHFARTYHEGLIALTSEKWDLLKLDHDLADYTGSALDPQPDRDPKRDWTGNDVMKFLARNLEHVPAEIVCISRNPDGIRNIESHIRSIQRLLADDF
jgi:hypothetical protein